MPEVRAWITGNDGLTAADLKAYLEHVPDRAHLEDADGELLGAVEAVWEVSTDA